MSFGIGKGGQEVRKSTTEIIQYNEKHTVQQKAHARIGSTSTSQVPGVVNSEDDSRARSAIWIIGSWPIVLYPKAIRSMRSVV